MDEEQALYLAMYRNFNSASVEKIEALKTKNKRIQRFTGCLLLTACGLFAKKTFDYYVGDESASSFIFPSLITSMTAAYYNNDLCLTRIYDFLLNTKKGELSEKDIENIDKARDIGQYSQTIGLATSTAMIALFMYPAWYFAIPFGMFNYYAGKLGHMSYRAKADVAAGRVPHIRLSGYTGPNDPDLP